MGKVLMGLGEGRFGVEKSTWSCPMQQTRQVRLSRIVGIIQESMGHPGQLEHPKCSTN